LVGSNGAFDLEEGHSQEDLVDWGWNQILMLNDNRVSLSIHLLEMTWTSIANESTVDHDNDVVAEGLSFVHSVSSQDHRRGIETLEHLEEAAAGHWVDTSSWLVQELYLGVCNEGHGTDELSLITSTEVFSSGIGIRIEIKSVFDEVLLELNIFLAETLDFSDVVDALINSKDTPDGVMLGAHTHLVSLRANINLIEISFEDLDIATSSLQVHGHDVEHGGLTSSIWTK